MNDDLLPMLLEQMGRLLGDLIDRELLIQAEQGHRPDALWSEIEQFGLLDAFSTSAGEGGLDLASAAPILSLMGYHAVPLPVGETMLARFLLAQSGIEAPEGPIALAWSPRNGSGLSHSGYAEHLIVREGRQLLLVRTGGRSLASISRLPRTHSEIRSLARTAEGPYPGALPSPGEIGAMMRASEMAGAIRRLLELTVDYAKVRHQFGRPIGRFQAVQQMIARLASAGAAAQSSADVAWTRLAAGRLGVAHAVAKITAGECARSATAIAHQVHGAIGVTDEHMLHYHSRRLWEWRLDFGSDALWAEYLGREARRAGGLLWPFLTDDGASPLSNEV